MANPRLNMSTASRAGRIRPGFSRLNHIQSIRESEPGVGLFVPPRRLLVKHSLSDRPPPKEASKLWWVIMLRFCW